MSQDTTRRMNPYAAPKAAAVSYEVQRGEDGRWRGYVISKDALGVSKLESETLPYQTMREAEAAVRCK